MEIYSTEEQQEEAIKNFLKENGLNIVVGAVLGVSGWLGWNWYSDKQLAEKEAASAQYEKFAEVAQAADVTLETVNSELNQFVAQYGESGYAIFAQLIAAKQAVIEGKFEQAEKSLTAAAAQAESSSLKDLVTVRLARVQIEQEKFDAALTSLNAVSNEGYSSRVAELKGDVYLAQGNTDKARSEYQAAADKGGLETNTVLKMKLDDLALSAKL
ncbi:MAG: tetratricopeptide repeat protein [Gammaproteobacteria bacterium]|nr:tetratricopeptide repeat protein [Gammaproteobacteria bacterium]